MDIISGSSSVIWQSCIRPCIHLFIFQYLGADLEEISGRTILEEEAEIELPLVTLPGTILVPGHIIPLYSHDQHEVAMLKSVVDSADKTFGVVALR